jgi:FkbM family methyltransferase
MLKKALLFASRSNWMRQAAQNSFRLPLIGASLRWAAGQMLPRGQRTWIQINKGPGEGLWIEVEPYWEPGYLQGQPEPFIQEILAENLKAGDCFYDIGAHIGYYALIAGRLVGPKGCVIAFEPDPDNVVVFEENVKKNGFNHVSVVAAAGWNSDGQISFERGEDQPSRMGGRVINGESNGADSKRTMTCRTITLDGFCQSHRPPTVVMIDAEGGEIEVLQGAQTVIRQHRPDFLIEVHAERNLPIIQEMLSRSNYGVRIIARYSDKLHVYCSRENELIDSGMTIR